MLSLGSSMESMSAVYALTSSWTTERSKQMRVLNPNSDRISSKLSRRGECFASSVS